jgi:UDP-N-acetylglucosamine--N-acetylmuramyl-(pentapeptide) pyrophosphoryl-undecaprenol N-acetylglucosamine transferase
VWAAQRLGFPTFLHEQNKRLGMANRLCAARATRIFLSYPDTIGDYPAERAMVVGNPVRSGFINPPEQRAARKQFGLEPNVPVVLVSGGSQGARTLNRAVLGMAGNFGPGELQLLWMTGRADFAEMKGKADAWKERVQVHPFIEDMPAACAAADLIVGRAGASSTAEIAVLGKPSVLVPFPFATDNHQEHNARAFVDAGAAVLLLDKECDPASLEKIVRELLNDATRLERMGQAAKGLARPVAAETVVEEIITEIFSGDDSGEK